MALVACVLTAVVVCAPELRVQATSIAYEIRVKRDMYSAFVRNASYALRGSGRGARMASPSGFVQMRRNMVVSESVNGNTKCRATQEPFERRRRRLRPRLRARQLVVELAVFHDGRE